MQVQSINKLLVIAKDVCNNGGSINERVKMNKPHIHKDVIIAWANGATIQYKVTGSDVWDDCSQMPSFFDDMEYRIKPEREYPVTSLPRAILSEIYFSIAVKEMTVYADALEEVANAAIKKHIIDTEGK